MDRNLDGTVKATYNTGDGQDWVVNFTEMATHYDSTGASSEKSSFTLLKKK